MVQKYQSPVRIYKYPFELVMAVSDPWFSSPLCDGERDTGGQLCKNEREPLRLPDEKETGEFSFSLVTLHPATPAFSTSSGVLVQLTTLQDLSFSLLKQTCSLISTSSDRKREYHGPNHCCHFVYANNSNSKCTNDDESSSHSLGVSSAKYLHILFHYSHFTSAKL